MSEDFVVGFARCNESREILAMTLDSIDASSCKPSKIIVVDNGDVPMPADLAARVEIDSPGRNIGCAAGWNRVFELARGQRCITINGDCAVAPDAFEKMLAIPSPTAILAFGFGCFLIDASIRERVGGFDENFYPAYYEDGDYRRRLGFAGVPIIEWPIEYVERLALGRDRTSTGFVHGSYDPDGYQGWRGEKLAWFWECYEKNSRYYNRKWGGEPGHETFTVPFDGQP